MKIAVIGTGYVGLVAGAGFSDFGNFVTCVDIDAERIDALNKGVIPIYEPGLHDLVVRNAKRGRLTFTTELKDAIQDVDAVFLAVGTPQSADGRANLEYVLQAARDVGKYLTQWAVIATKSTVPVGTADKVRAAVAEHAKVEFSVASNPEFLKEGDAINDFMKPARVVVGVEDERSAKVLQNLYAPFVRTRNRIMVTDVRSAELIKYAANSMLATRISFMNEIALLAEKVGADVEKVRQGVGSDPRIGNKFLFPGPGYGGSCFPKDLRALLHTASEHDHELYVTAAVDKANERQKQVLAQRVIDFFGGDLAGKRIALWGLAFKAETDDIRESPALVTARRLAHAGAEVVAFDPQAMDNTRAELGDIIQYASDPYEATQDADALVLVTEWKEFRRPAFSDIKERMRGNALFDGRNVWSRDEVRKLGFVCYGIGRGSSVPT
ncbi:MAG: UDP-glucose/GDP-mannose dehydrogenase family protein [Deltaproteobacteria bacterium]|nr:UDP-glucose/GDP-mannose dehydrogenase family protein [Deltaproteobacteria bacterium]